MTHAHGGDCVCVCVWESPTRHALAYTYTWAWAEWSGDHKRRRVTLFNACSALFILSRLLLRSMFSMIESTKADEAIWLGYFFLFQLFKIRLFELRIVRQCFIVVSVRSVTTIMRVFRIFYRKKMNYPTSGGLLRNKYRDFRYRINWDWRPLKDRQEVSPAHLEDPPHLFPH